MRTPESVVEANAEATAESDQELARDAAVLTRYLLGCDPDDRERQLFARAARQAPLSSPSEQRQWRFAIRHAGWLPYLDAALARAAPTGAVRHRLLLMLAILEASPRHAAHFLPAPFGPGGVLVLLWTGALGVWHALIGAALLRLRSLT